MRVKENKARWIPQSKKQWQALLCQADELYYGGAAGGGKSDLVIGMAIECHEQSAIFRRVYPNLKAIIRRTRELLKDDPEWKENKADKAWTHVDGRSIEFGAMQHEDDKTNWQGRPHDLKAFDEIPEFTESQYLFASGWNRTTNPTQRTRVVCTGNPPIDEAGSWVIERWGAWLKKDHPNRADPGELRYYATVDGDEQEFENGEPVEINGEIIYPRSRTFIPASLDDNPFYKNDPRYRSVLQSLPEPLRSMLLYGDFDASAVIDPFQVIPTDWVKEAQKRWRETDKPDTPLTAVGVDPARGGRDNFAIAKRYDLYFDEIEAKPGAAIKDGKDGRNFIHEIVGDFENPDIIIDVIGIGSSVYDYTSDKYQRVIAFNAAEGSNYRDASGRYKMRNKRAELYWRFRDLLDPKNGNNACLPPGNEIIADLCSARYKVGSSGILIEEKEEIKKRIGRSPDKGEALLLANVPVAHLFEKQPEKSSKWVNPDEEARGRWRKY